MLYQTVYNDDDDNNNNNNFIKLSGYFLTCRLKNTIAYYKASTKNQNITTVKYTKKQNTKQAKQKQCGRKKTVHKKLK
jgi:hypothetical protein